MAGGDDDPPVYRCIMEGCDREFTREATMLAHVQSVHFKQPVTVAYYDDLRGTKQIKRKRASGDHHGGSDAKRAVRRRGRGAGRSSGQRKSGTGARHTVFGMGKR